MGSPDTRVSQALVDIQALVDGQESQVGLDTLVSLDSADTQALVDTQESPVLVDILE